MRLGLSLSLLVACGPSDLALDRVEPAEGLAIGGELVTLYGRGFTEGLEIRFGDRHSPHVEVIDPRTAQVELPSGIAGRVDLGATLDESSAELAEAFLYLPHDLTFVDPGPGWLPDLEGLLDGWAGDLNGDGIDDVMVLDTSYGLSWWRGTGSGSLLDDGSLVDEPLNDAALVDVDGDGHLDVLTCPRDNTSPRVLYGAPDSRPLGQVDTLPVMPGRCDAIGLGPDGTIALSRRSGSGSVIEILLPTGDGFTRSGEPIPGSCPVTSEAECEVTLDEGGRPTASITLAASSELIVAQAMDRLPTAVEVEVIEADVLLSVFFVDDEGERFSAPIEEIGVQVIRDLSSWESDGEGEGEIDLPLRSFGIAMEHPGDEELATVKLASVIAHLTGSARMEVATFTEWIPPIALPQRQHRLAIADVDGDQRSDILVGSAATGGSLTGFVAQGDTFVPIATSRLDAVRCGIRDLVATPILTRHTDLLVSCRDGQDRLLINDGSGRWFDDSARALPFGRGDSARLTLQDLDLDGRPELLIAKREGVDRLYGSVGDRWIDRTARLGLSLSDTRRLLSIDIDLDGALDVIGLGPDGAWVRVAAPSGPRQD